MPRTRLTQQARKAKTREAIVAAATRRFALRGVEATSLDDVAEAAGFTKGAIYANFPNKRALVDAVIERNIVQIDPALLVRPDLSFGRPTRPHRPRSGGADPNGAEGDGAARPRVQPRGAPQPAEARDAPRSSAGTTATIEGRASAIRRVERGARRPPANRVRRAAPVGGDPRSGNYPRGGRNA